MNATFEAREPSAAPPPPRLPAAAPGYEFSAAQEVLIASLARLMRIVGGVSVAFGALVVVLGLMAGGNGVAAFVQGALMLVIGVLTFAAGGRFAQVAETTGRDIALLMEALDKLRTLYLVQVWMLGIALAMLALVFVWLAVVLASR